jgi:glycosyltransferase involved in cell wall biosynthesis
MIIVDADVLGRGRTGEETYLANLLRELPAAAPDLQFAAVTRHPELVPDGVEPVALSARFQEVRMAASLPRLLRRLRPGLAHFQHALPLGYGGRSVITLHDLHFERDPGVMSFTDRLTFRAVVPRSSRKADHVLAVSERTKRDAIELYGVPADRITVTPLAADPAFAPGDGSHDGFLLFVGAVQARKDPLAALDAATATGLPLVVVGPEKDRALAAELRRRGADVRGSVPKAELADLYRRAAAVLLLSRYEGFGIPVLEAMASGTPVVLSSDPALREVAGTAGVYGSVAEALAQRERYRAAGLERAAHFSWRRTAELTVGAYRRVLAA